MRSIRNGALSTDLGFLIDTLDDFERRIRTLEAPSGESLGNTVAKLAASIAQTVKPASIYKLVDSAAITSAASDVATVSVPVPDGYTRAIVNVTASATLRSNDAAGGWALLMVAATIIGGGSAYNQWASVDGQKYGGTSASSAAVLENLVPGSTIDVAARVSFPGAYTLGRASVAGSVLFLR